MAGKTVAQLTSATSIASGDLVPIWPVGSGGPLKQVAFSVFQSQLASALGVTYAQVANNLSDLTNAATARVNLGLGTAAAANIGSAAGTVAAGNDSRITGAAQLGAIGLQTFNGNIAMAGLTATTGNFSATITGPSSLAIGNGVTTGLNGDGTNLSLRAYGSTGTIYFTNANGSGAYGTANSTGWNLTGAITASGGVTVGTVLTASGTSGSGGSALVVTNANTGYGGQFQLNNSNGGATNPNKYFRINNSGNLEILNSNYGSAIFTLSDTGGISGISSLSVGGPGTFSGALSGASVAGAMVANAATTLAGASSTTLVTPAGLAGNSSIAANGYYKLPGGLVIAWGSVSTAGGGTTSATFPYTFTNVYSVQGTEVGTGGGAASGPAIYNVSTTGCQFVVNPGASVTSVYYVVIGT